MTVAPRRVVSQAAAMTRAKCSVCFAAFIAVTVVGAFAQDSSSYPRRLRPGIDVEQPPLDTIEAAEAEAETYPQTPVHETRVPDGLAKAEAGTSDRKCVETSGHNILRSGEFVAANFASLPTSEEIQRWGWNKLVWIRLHPAANDSESLVVRAKRLGQPVQSIAFRYPVPHSTAITAFPTIVPLFDRGRWMLVATSGSDWGCFVFEAR